MSSNTDRATDKRPQFILIEQEVIDSYHLDPYTGWLYAVIIRHADKKTGEAFPGIQRLAELANMSKMQVMRCIARLEGKGLIVVERSPVVTKGEKRERGVNHYVVLGVSGRHSQTLGVVTDSEYPSNHELVPVVTDSDNNQNHSELESNNHKPAPKRESYPKRLLEWKQSEMDRYYTEHAIDLDALVEAWGYNSRFKDQTLTERRLFVQCYRELSDCGFPVENYTSLGSFTRAKLSWKGAGMKPTEMLAMVEEWRNSRLNGTTTNITVLVPEPQAIDLSAWFTPESAYTKGIANDNVE